MNSTFVRWTLPPSGTELVVLKAALNLWLPWENAHWHGRALQTQMRGFFWTRINRAEYLGYRPDYAPGEFIAFFATECLGLGDDIRLRQSDANRFLPQWANGYISLPDLSYSQITQLHRWLTDDQNTILKCVDLESTLDKLRFNDS